LDWQRHPGRGAKRVWVVGLRWMGPQAGWGWQGPPTRGRWVRGGRGAKRVWVVGLRWMGPQARWGCPGLQDWGWVCRAGGGFGVWVGGGFGV